MGIWTAGLEGVVIDVRADLQETYRGAKVLVTGHTGFKGAWLVMWLSRLGAEVTGLALVPPTEPSLFDDLRLVDLCTHNLVDVRDLHAVSSTIERTSPDLVFHLAAQAIVREGYLRPLETFWTNVMGTANVLEAVRRSDRPCAVVVVTSDKSYELDPGAAARHEGDPLGGDDPYSASKAASELIVRGYRGSILASGSLSRGAAVATARAGNVIGGGDWSPDRIVPDAIRALMAGQPIGVRNPGHVRPWQHVLGPLEGYLLLGARLIGADRDRYCESWNFGPSQTEECTVAELVGKIICEWGEGSWERDKTITAMREAPSLRLDISKASSRLGWHPRWDLQTAVGRTVEWYRARHKGASVIELRELCLSQIDSFMNVQ